MWMREDIGYFKGHKHHTAACKAAKVKTSTPNTYVQFTNESGGVVQWILVEQLSKGNIRPIAAGLCHRGKFHPTLLYRRNASGVLTTRRAPGAARIEKLVYGF